MVIEVGNKKYMGQCNALSYVFYRRIFEANIFDDINILKKELYKIVKNLKHDNGIKFYNVLIKLIYTLIYTHNQNFINFEKWKNEIKKERISDKVVDEIIEIYLKSFVDTEVKNELEKLPSGNGGKEVTLFPEHDFLSICLKLNLSLQDLKILTYIDVLKIFLSNCDVAKNNGYRNATQADWDRLALS